MIVSEKNQHIELYDEENIFQTVYVIQTAP